MNNDLFGDIFLIAFGNSAHGYFKLQKSIFLIHLFNLF